jgi:hypothetical protein
LRVLQTCKEPVFAYRSLTEWDNLSVSSRQFLSRSEAEAEPAVQKCVALQLYPADLYGPEPGWRQMYKELHVALRLLGVHDTAAVYLRLDTARRVVLLFDPCWQTPDRDKWARLLEEQITEFWEQEEITDGRVDVLSY